MNCLIFYILILLNQNYSTFTVESGRDIKMYWKGKDGKVIGSFDRIEDKVIFATNAGAYDENQKPIGLYIQEGKVITKINKAKGTSNFSTYPNGVFYINESSKSGICVTEKFINKNIRYAQQSGPMLVIDGTISPSVKNKTNSAFIRNGVGILKDGTTIFAISKTKITMSEFAKYFVEIGCENALYLDGGVSQAFPMKAKPTQHFGVIIGVINPTNND
jgi:uncharacterized protein YigE (DUF2233 family)